MSYIYSFCLNFLIIVRFARGVRNIGRSLGFLFRLFLGYLFFRVGQDFANRSNFIIPFFEIYQAHSLRSTSDDVQIGNFHADRDARLVDDH